MTITVPTDQNAAAALVAYEKYFDILWHMTKAGAFDENLKNYADLSAFTKAQNSVTQMRNLGVVNTGTITGKATVTSVDMAAKPLPIVKATVCINAAKWWTIYNSGSKKGQYFNKDQNPPYPVTVTIHQSADGHWRVTDTNGKDGATC